MMKRKVSIVLILILSLSVCAFTGCFDTADDSSSQSATTYTVTFNSNGGTAVESKTVKDGEKIAEPENPTKLSTATQDFEFDGWYNGDEKWVFSSDVVTGNIELVAVWKVVGEYTTEFLPTK